MRSRASRPTRIAARPIDSLERHSHDFRRRARDRSRQELLGDIPDGRFVFQQPGSLRDDPEADRCSGRQSAAIPFEQCNHRFVSPRIGLIDSGARSIDIGVGIRAVRQQNLRKVVPAQSRTLTQRLARRGHDFVEPANSPAFVRVEPQVQKQREDAGRFDFTAWVTKPD